MRFPYPVPLNRAYRTFRGMTVLSKEGKEWKRAAALIAQAAGTRPIEGPVACMMILHPKLTKQGRASKTRMDLDAIFKLALDALNGIAWVDDKQIEFMTAIVGHPVAEGGLTVEVRSVG